MLHCSESPSIRFPELTTLYILSTLFLYFSISYLIESLSLTSSDISPLALWESSCFSTISVEFDSLFFFELLYAKVTPPTIEIATKPTAAAFIPDTLPAPFNTLLAASLLELFNSVLLVLDLYFLSSVFLYDLSSILLVISEPPNFSNLELLTILLNIL